MKIFLFFLTYWTKLSKGSVKVMFVVSMLANILMGASSIVLLALINRILASEDGGQEHLPAFIAAVIIFPIFFFLSNILIVRLGNGAVFDLQTRLCRLILGVPYRFLEKLGASKILIIIHDDVRNISEAITRIIQLITYTFVTLFGLAYLIWLSPYLFAWTIGGLLIGVIGYRIITIPAWGLLHAAREAAAQRFANFRSLANGNKEMKLHRDRARSFFELIFYPTLTTFHQRVIRGHLFYAAGKGWSQGSYFLILGLLLFLVPQFRTVPKAELLSFGIVLLYLITPFQFIMDCFYWLGRANPSMQKIEELGISLQDQAMKSDIAEMVQPKNDWKKIELRDVEFAYEDLNNEHPFKFGPMNMTLSPGELVFIIGGNGSGKTTLAKLLIGLYQQDKGEILLDDQPVTKETRDAYRQNFSVVFTDFFLFESLLGMDRDNLDQRAGQYLKDLEIDHKVRIEDGQLSTTHLSQGQRKRLALLTAYLEDRPIYVFDEWAADQDQTFREIFYNRLLPDLRDRGKAVVVITHDDKYFDKADRVIRLEFGDASSNGKEH